MLRVRTRIRVEREDYLTVHEMIEKSGLPIEPKDAGNIAKSLKRIAREKGVKPSSEMLKYQGANDRWLQTPACGYPPEMYQDFLLLLDRKPKEKVVAPTAKRIDRIDVPADAAKFRNGFRFDATTDIPHYVSENGDIYMNNNGMASAFGVTPSAVTHRLKSSNFKGKLNRTVDTHFGINPTNLYPLSVCLEIAEIFNQEMPDLLQKLQEDTWKMLEPDNVIPYAYSGLSYRNVYGRNVQVPMYSYGKVRYIAINQLADCLKMQKEVIAEYLREKATLYPFFDLFDESFYYLITLGDAQGFMQQQGGHQSELMLATMDY